MIRSESTIERAGEPSLFVRRWEPESSARYSLVLVHGTAGHGGCYEDFAQAMARRGARVFAPDLRGHGRSGGGRGRFSMSGLLDDVAAVAGHAAAAGEPVVLLGASQGGEVAFHGLARSDDVDAAVCMNILLARHKPLNRRMELMQSKAVGALAWLVGDRVSIPLRRVIDFRAAYREDPSLLPAKLADPTYVWNYGLRSYRSIFTYRPPRDPGDNDKPVLVAVGADDPIVGADHCQACAAMIGGPVSVHVMPRAGHQLMQFHRERFADVVDHWVEHAVLGASAEPWQPPADADAEVYERFLAEQAQLEPTSEYRLGPLDRGLARISNGSITHGVEFFATAKHGELGRFITRVVGQIDRAAWPCFERWLPEHSGRIAVLGCGSGHVIDVLRRCEPRLRGWEVVGLDVDHEAIEQAREHFATDPGVDVRVLDARRLDEVEPAAFDVIYAHGLFDHCADHRGLLAAAHGALAPGGVLLYITPDRNLSTWLQFVAVGPRLAFGLDHYADLHDYRRFPRPAELDALAREVGLEVVDDPEDAGRPYHRGVDYAASPLRIRASVRRRDLDGLGLVITRPRWWLGGGFAGEYIGVLRRPRT